MAPTDPTTPAWDDKLLSDPHTVADKRRRVQQMFSAIAPSYDLNNRLHSFWRDQAWRRKAVKLAEVKATDVVVDVACGTGDLTYKFACAIRDANRPETFKKSQITGVDFAFKMLPIAKLKGRSFIWPSKFERPGFKVNPRRMDHAVAFINGDATALPLPDACCDVVSIAFGIRNVQEPMQALREFRRVLRPGGRLIILEFSQPTNPLLRVLNNFYCGRIMPITATLISGDKSGAYKYLPKSVASFMSREKMCRMMADAGFNNVHQFPLTFGVCVCYRGYVG